MRLLNIVFLSLIFLTLGCNRNPHKIDVSDIDVNISVKRFDQDLFALKANDLNFEGLKADYGDFLSLYCNQVIGVGPLSDTLFSHHMGQFLNDSLMSCVFAKCQEVFPDLKLQEKILTSAFKHYKYYFPKSEIPALYAHISGFNQSMVVAPNIVSISLDRYLGSDSRFYEQLGTPLYARQKMTPERIPVDVVLAFGLTEFPFKPVKDNVLSNMIYQGKIRYFIQAMMPKISEMAIMGYEKQQMEWCIDNQETMWSFLIGQKHLFSSQYRLIMNYINDGPFTPGMPQESPSRTGIWLGMQIVKEYMRLHPEKDLKTLMMENDYEMILRQSGYQP